jgi:hypothetical protein
VQLADYERRVPPETRKSAEQQLVRIFSAAGVDIQLLREGATAPKGRWSIEVLLLSDAMAHRLIDERQLEGHVLGITAGGRPRAYILVDRVLHLASHSGSDPGDTLGTIIAHEIGHLLLLPHAGESFGGIMQPKYEMLSRAQRRFTPTEADAIKIALGSAAAKGR